MSVTEMDIFRTQRVVASIFNKRVSGDGLVLVGRWPYPGRLTNGEQGLAALHATYIGNEDEK
jgi:hypothetical protein